VESSLNACVAGFVRFPSATEIGVSSNRNCPIVLFHCAEIMVDPQGQCDENTQLSWSGNMVIVVTLRSRF
jgi:hypothetical protein